MEEPKIKLHDYIVLKRRQSCDLMSAHNVANKMYHIDFVNGTVRNCCALCRCFIYLQVKCEI